MVYIDTHTGRYCFFIVQIQQDLTSLSFIKECRKNVVLGQKLLHCTCDCTSQSPTWFNMSNVKFSCGNSIKLKCIKKKKKKINSNFFSLEMCMSLLIFYTINKCTSVIILCLAVSVSIKSLLCLYFIDKICFSTTLITPYMAPLKCHRISTSVKTEMHHHNFVSFRTLACVQIPALWFHSESLKNLIFLL